MSIKSRVNRVEGAFKSLDKSNYNTVIIVEKIYNSDIWEVIKSGEVVFTGTKEIIEETFLLPYYNGGSTVIWSDIPRP